MPESVFVSRSFQLRGGVCRCDTVLSVAAPIIHQSTAAPSASKVNNVPVKMVHCENGRRSPPVRTCLPRLRKLSDQAASSEIIPTVSRSIMILTTMAARTAKAGQGRSPLVPSGLVVRRRAPLSRARRQEAHESRENLEHRQPDA